MTVTRYNKRKVYRAWAKKRLSSWNLLLFNGITSKMDVWMDFGLGRGQGGGMRLSTDELLEMKPGEEVKFFTDFPGRHRALITGVSQRHRVKFETRYINGVLVVKRVDDDEGRHPKVVVPLKLGIPKRGSRIRAVAEIDHHGDWKVKAWELDGVLT